MTPDEKLLEVEEKVANLRSAIQVTRRNRQPNVRQMRSIQVLVENIHQDLLRWRETDEEATWQFRKASAPQ